MAACGARAAGRDAGGRIKRMPDGRAKVRRDVIPRDFFARLNTFAVVMEAFAKKPFRSGLSLNFRDAYSIAGFSRVRPTSSATEG